MKTKRYSVPAVMVVAALATAVTLARSSPPAGNPGHTPAAPPSSSNAGSRSSSNAGSSMGNADAHASVMGDARGRSVATLAAGGASASLDTAATVHSIQSQAMASRETLLAELHTRVDASDKAMADVRKSGAKLDGDDKAHFDAAVDDMKAKEKALKKSLKAAEKANADAWGDARSHLATDFEAFGSAVERAEAASRGQAK